MTIPCWWDGTIESLASTINFQRPDLLSEDFSKLIPLNPWVNYFIVPEIPNIGELMLASFADLTFSPSPFEWWIGEKYDGVRCYWDTLTQSTYSRHGREVELLPIYTKEMPKISIDCELWYGRGQYALSSELVSRNVPYSWDFLRMVTFDVIPILTLEISFEDRYSCMLCHIRPDHLFSIPAFRVLCQGDLHVKRFADDVIQKGGEGVIFRKLASHYEIGRSLSLLKLKTAMGDKEAMVVGIEDDGSLELKLPNSVTFLVPRKDVHIAKPSLGDIVSFSYDESSRLDIPNHPSVFRIRTDIEWDDVVSSSCTEKSGTSAVFKTKPLHYWTEGNLRKHLEQIALSMNLDPLLASTWHTITPSKLADFEGGNSILYSFRGGFHKNIQALFPEIYFQFDRVLADPLDPKSRREFFVNYAKRKGFDPLYPENWYTQLATNVGNEKGGRTVLSYYDSRLRTALISLFPEIGLDESRFKIQESWKDENKRRGILLDFAKANNFDPLKSENWETVSGRRFIRFSSAANTILKSYYSSSLLKAVLALFPNIGFPQYEKGNSWIEKSARRSFFEKYAKKRNFDPLNTENWYSLTLMQINAEKGAFGVMAHHKNDYRCALIDLFPEIGLLYSKFSSKKVPLAFPKKQVRSLKKKLASIGLRNW
eukprot:Phypoly_transcript_02652.p1 GENE.Phypoly_transcript_02652~~Phypoly_transcript_02652.p1  ORF type:complete len:698 (+),score=61.56 Phypoly_transcript_02652:137-2095(+)